MADVSGKYAPYVVTSILAADATVSSVPCYVHWVTASNSHATETCAIELADVTTDLWGVILGDVDGASATVQFNFDPPIKFSTNCILDVTTGTPRVVVGFTKA